MTFEELSARIEAGTATPADFAAYTSSAVEKGRALAERAEATERERLREAKALADAEAKVRGRDRIARALAAM